MLASDGPCQNRPKTFSRSDARDAVALVVDAHDDRTRPRAVQRHGDGAAPWRSAFSMRLKKICSSRSESAHISGSPCSCALRPSSSRTGAAGPAQLVAHHVAAQQVVQVDRAEPQVEAVGVEPGDVEQLGDEPGQPVGVGLDRLDHESLLLIGEAVPAPQQAAREARHRRQRRPQLVGDGRQHGRLVALGPLPGLGVAQAEHDPFDASRRRRPRTARSGP